MLSLFREVACEIYGITIDEFNSRSKCQLFSEARALYFKLSIDAGASGKEAAMFINGRTSQSSRVYKNMASYYLEKSPTFKNNYYKCTPLYTKIVQMYKNSSDNVHSITKYTKSEELRILHAIRSAMRFMRTYGKARK